VTIDLPISVETEQKLKQHAQAAGQDVTSFVLEALEEKLASASAKENNLTREQRLALFQEWASSQKSQLTEVDDSRESIYEGRGE
jgi:uncharacterized protein (DUF1778 family)